MDYKAITRDIIKIRQSIASEMELTTSFIRNDDGIYDILSEFDWQRLMLYFSLSNNPLPDERELTITIP